MDDIKKARRKVKELILVSKAERDEKGYRENLGYDRYGDLQDYLATLHLTYLEESQILQSFDSECANI